MISGDIVFESKRIGPTDSQEPRTDLKPMQTPLVNRQRP